MVKAGMTEAADRPWWYYFVLAAVIVWWRSRRTGR